MSAETVTAIAAITGTTFIVVSGIIVGFYRLIAHAIDQRLDERFAAVTARIDDLRGLLEHYISNLHVDDKE